MQNFIDQTGRKSHKLGFTVGAIGAAALLSLASAAIADEPLAMAPPIQPDSSLSQSIDSGAATADSVFDWSEVPQNQQVPISRAVFDQGGYQLYDTSGETIVIPFTNNNLYVMKFAVSDNDTMYFINTGTVPVLYVPDNGYLENESVPGAKWYPFTPDFQPATPVFLGCAPSWNDFVDMGWYPDMCSYGGYWCDGPIIQVGAVFPSVGLFFEIGGRHFDGWQPYHRYYDENPAPYNVTIVNRNVYNWERPQYARNRVFADGWQSSRHDQFQKDGRQASHQDYSQPQGRVFSGGGQPFFVRDSGTNQAFSGNVQPAQQTVRSAPSDTSSHYFMGAAPRRSTFDTSVNLRNLVQRDTETTSKPVFQGGMDRQIGVPHQSDFQPAPARSFQSGFSGHVDQLPRSVAPSGGDRSSHDAAPPAARDSGGGDRRQH